MTVIESAPAIKRTRIDLGDVFKGAWKAFIDDIVPLLLASLIALVLTIVSIGILGGPLFAGLVGMVIARRDGKTPQVGDVFNGFDRFWAYLGAALALLILIGLASLTIVGGFLLAAIWFYVFPLMVDRRLGLGEAMRVSKDMVLKAGFWEHVALVIIVFAIDAIVPGVLSLLTTPLFVALVGVSYLQAAALEAPAPAA